MSKEHNAEERLISSLENILSTSNETLRALMEAGGLDPQVAFCGADLRGVDLSAEDLRGINFAHADLREVALDFADLRGANFNAADLRGASLSYANLESTDLRHAVLEGACFEKSNLEKALFSQDTWSALAKNFESNIDALRDSSLVSASPPFGSWTQDPPVRRMLLDSLIGRRIQPQRKQKWQNSWAAVQDPALRWQERLAHFDQLLLSKSGWWDEKLTLTEFAHNVAKQSCRSNAFGPLRQGWIDDEHIAHQALAILYERAPRLAEKSPREWLIHVIQRLVETEVEALEEMHPSNGRPEGISTQADVSLIRELGSEASRILKLHLQGYTDARIAKITGLSAEDVKSRLGEALRVVGNNPDRVKV